MKNKEKVLGLLLILSLGFNGFFAYKFINLEKTVAKMSMEELITNVDKGQPQDHSGTDDAMEALKKGDNATITENKTSKDVTEEYRDQLLKLYENKDYDGITELIIEKDISIGYEPDREENIDPGNPNPWLRIKRILSYAFL